MARRASLPNGPFIRGSLWLHQPSVCGELTLHHLNTMQELVTLECTEAKKEGKPTSATSPRANKKTVTERIEKKK